MKLCHALRPDLALVPLVLLAAPSRTAGQDCQGSGLNLGMAPDPTFATVMDGDDLQVAIDMGQGTGMPHVVEVAPGTYGPIEIDVSMFVSLTIYSTDGPYDFATGTPLTTIQGNGTIPAVEIEGDPSTSIPVLLGWATSADPDAWQGFRITGGFQPDFMSGGGGIQAFSQLGPLEIRGNVIEGNDAVQAGGGVYLANCPDALVAVNEIRDNRAGLDGLYVSDPFFPMRGAGLYQLRGNLDLIGNLVHDNTFDVGANGFTPEPARQGGGVAAFLGQVEGGAYIAACDNEIHHNDASEGGGVWIDIDGNGFDLSAHLEENEVHENVPWVPSSPPGGLLIDGGYRGGGVFLRGRNIGQKPFFGSADGRMYNNRVRDNEARNPGFVPSAVDDVGGGAYVEFVIRDGFDEVELVGNALWLNEAPVEGGGAYLDFSDTGAGLIHHNTLAWNELDAMGLGGGLFLTGSTSFDGSSNVIFENTVPGSTGNENDWYADPAVADVFRYTQMPAYSGAGADLFTAGIDNDAASPELAQDDPHLTEGSPCLETAEPIALLTLPIAVDIDNHPRYIDWDGVPGDGRDRGADEFVAFKRGNANGDDMLDIADGIYILEYLFNMGPAPQSPDSADVNDDGSIDISDPIYLFEYLFSMGPQPPEPFTTCGADSVPDLDGLGPGIGTPWF